MQVREYQQWLEAWDRTRGWDRVSVAHTLVHAMEELGEVARLVLQWEGYKNATSPEQLRTDLAEELSDVFVFLFKVAYQTGVDVESALVFGQEKAERRYADLELSAAELERYQARQDEIKATQSDSEEQQVR